MTTCLFGVFNQTVVPWLMTLCVLNEKSVENYALLGLLALPFDYLPFVGLAVMWRGAPCAKACGQGACPPLAWCSHARICLCWRLSFQCFISIFLQCGHHYGGRALLLLPFRQAGGGCGQGAV